MDLMEAKVADREFAELKTENEDLRKRVATLEQQVGTEQRECQRILEMVLDLSRHARPGSCSRSTSPPGETLGREGSVGTRITAPSENFTREGSVASRGTAL